MRILLVTGYFPPEVRSAAQLMQELADTLAALGHDVTVVTTFPPSNVEVDAAAAGQMARYRGRLFMRERRGRVQVIRVATLPFNKMPPLVRSFAHFTLAASLCLGGLAAGHHDVIWAYSPPLTLGLTCYLLGALWGRPYLVNVQDLHPQALIDLGLLRNRTAIRLFEWLERFVYRHAAHLVVHSEGNRQAVHRRGVSLEKIAVMPNWVDTEMLRPQPRLNGFRRRHMLGDGLVVLFAGVMGYAQDMQVILNAAAAMRRRQDVTFLLVGDGVGKLQAEHQAADLKLHNVRFLPLQPAEVYPEVVAAADVCLVTLRPDVATPVVPSKILGIMAAGRPIVGALPTDSDAVKLIYEAGCGLCVPAGDAAAMAEAIRRLADAPSLRSELGRHGRHYAETHLDRRVVIQQCEAMMAAAVDERSGRPVGRAE